MSQIGFVLISLFLAAQTWASGRTVGNGGDVVVCEDSAGLVQSIELLDFYEGRVLKGILTNLGDSQWTVEKKIAFALSRLQRVSPVRARRYAEHAATFLSESLFLESAGLADISDTGDIVIPKGCRVAQIANQSKPLYPDDKRYVIDRSLWDALDNDNRAGLILHEVIYREALQLKHENSVSVRMLNANLSSIKIETMSVQTYTTFLQDLGFDTNSVQGALISLGPQSPEFYPNGLLKRALVVDGSTYQLASQTLQVRDVVSFYPSGKLEQLVLKGTHEIFIRGQNRTVSPYELSFYESGAVESATFEDPTEFQNQTYALAIQGAAHFHENGRIRLANVKHGWIEICGQRAEVRNVLQIDAKGNFREGILITPIRVLIGGRAILIHEAAKLDVSQRALMVTLAEESLLNLGTGTAAFSVWGKMYFHPGTEQIEKGCLAQDIVLRDSNGKKRLFPARTGLKFRIDGSVKSSEDRC